MLTMVVRVFVALIGALIVTSALLLGMDKVTSIFRTSSGERFFRITDVLPTPERGRPERPAAARRQPLLVDPELEVPEDGIEVTEPGPVSLPDLTPAALDADEILDPR